MSETRPRVLVTYGSKRGGTAEIAAAIHEEMLGAGLDVELEPAAAIADISEYDVVILGGALYMGRWQRDARRFVKRHAAVLRARTVYMFSSGPLDDSTRERDAPPPPSVAKLMEVAGTTHHITFGGRLERDADGLLASAIAKKHAGDWREWHQIRGWARDVAAAVKAEPRRAIIVEPPPTRWLLAALCFFVAFTAIGGGATLVIAPDGHLLEMPASYLAHSPFETFLIPGLLLFAVIGVGSLVAGALVVKDSRIANHVAFGAGAALLVWIVSEMGLLRSFHWLQVAYFTAATVIMIEAYRRWWATAAAH